MKKSFRQFSILSVLMVTILLLGTACKKDKISADSSHKLRFSLDTLSFDTVFSSVGSSTRIFKIYNPNDMKVNISSIVIGGGNASFFRVNVNGEPAVSYANVELRARDSLWVFAEVTVDPMDSNNPFLVKDSLVCITNGNLQKVIFEAFGQDVYFHKPLLGATNYDIPCNEVWKSDKPHLVFGTAVIDSNCSLEIEAGTRVYFHYAGALKAMKGASLKVRGELDNQVYFEGDRRESWYQSVAGQWEGVVLNEGSLDNELNFLQIKNARNGVSCQGDGNANDYSLVMNNCRVLNCSSNGIRLNSTTMQTNNLLVANCAGHELLIEKGGSYEFNHGTFANYVNAAQGNANSGNSVLVKNWILLDGAKETGDILQCDFNNCIISGITNNELELKDDGGVFNYQFTNCLITSSGGSNDGENFIANVFNADPSFQDVSVADFQLKANSGAVDVGSLNFVLERLPYLGMDLKGDIRTGEGSPDAGSYEHVGQP